MRDLRGSVRQRDDGHGADHLDWTGRPAAECHQTIGLMKPDKFDWAAAHMTNILTKLKVRSRIASRTVLGSRSPPTVRTDQ
jgi:hypothetical protein